MARARWLHDTVQPLGSAVIQITAIPEEDYALLTVRLTDQTVTAAQLSAIGRACLSAARRLRGPRPA